MLGPGSWEWFQKRLKAFLDSGWEGIFGHLKTEPAREGLK